jgi:hypothetical protein
MMTKIGHSYPYWSRFVPRAVIVMSHHNNLANVTLPNVPSNNDTHPSSDDTIDVASSSSSGDHDTNDDRWGIIGEPIRQCNQQCSNVVSSHIYVICLCPCNNVFVMMHIYNGHHD